MISVLVSDLGGMLSSSWSPSPHSSCFELMHTRWRWLRRLGSGLINQQTLDLMGTAVTAYTRKEHGGEALKNMVKTPGTGELAISRRLSFPVQ